MREFDMSNFEDEIILLLKMQNDNEHLKSLQNGKVYMNNLKYFIDLEKEKMNKGIGDKNEGSMKINHLFEFTIDDRIIPNIDSIEMKKSEIENTPIFSTTAILGKDVEIHKITSDRIELLIDYKQIFSENIKNLGENVLIIEPFSFKNKFKEYAFKNGLNLNADLIKYHNRNLNELKILNDCRINPENMAFYKDEYFKNQKEYRFLLSGLSKKEPYIAEIGDLQDISKIMTIDKLLNTKHLITMKLKPE